MLCVSLCLTLCQAMAQHPRLYTSDTERPSLLEKIANEPWADSTFVYLRTKIDAFTTYLQAEPDWLVSRLAMYWRDGEHYTQCYMKKQNWDCGEGNAPVPTVRMPGMRTWNKYQNVALKDRIPYNESGDFWAYAIGDTIYKVMVPYKESGHLVRSNNVEILTLAEEAAFLYWLTSEEKYGKMACDVFNTWLVGTWYMNPILDPEKSSGGAGGYEPGGICGYYDYEQIHDDLALHAAIIYDFAYDYINQHPHAHLKEIGKTTREVVDEVFKRFINIGMVRGGKSGNWNVNGWNMMLLPILMLEDDYAYADGHGRQYYLDFLLRQTTDYHDALPDILKSYDPVTGLWPESPGYAFGTINMLTDFAILLKRQGIDIIASTPTFQKAAIAFLPWMDSRGRMIVFGDSRGGVANFGTVENLYAYYKECGDEKLALSMATVLKKGMDTEAYSRNASGWRGLCTYVSLPKNHETASPVIRSSYSPFHRLVTMRSADDSLMAVVYGGRKGSHLSPNGLALQLYGFGYALAPDAAGYVSYWSDDYHYHQTATGSNTILPGYSEGDISVNTLIPYVESNHFTNTGRSDSLINFVDVTAAEKQRSVTIVSTGHGKGYYVDVFRSATETSDYLFHIIGQKLTLADEKGLTLHLSAIDSLGVKYSHGYDYFQNFQVTNCDRPFMAKWCIDGRREMNLWMGGGNNRQLVVAQAPHSTIINGLAPNDIGKIPHKVPTLIVRQQSDAWNQPFIGVFEPVDGSPMVKTVKVKKIDERQVSLIVILKDGRKDYISITTDGHLFFDRK